MPSTTDAPSPAPEGYPTVSPWIITDDTAAFVAFAREVVGAEERFPPVHADEAGTRIVHAELQVGDAVLMLFDRDEGWGPTPAFLNVWVPDCDEAHRRALAAGAVEVTGLSTNAWGDRGSRVRDPFGNLWWIQTHLEDLSEDEIAARMAEPAHADDLAHALETLDREMRRTAP